MRIGVLNPMGGIQRQMSIGIWNESGALLTSATITSPVSGSAVLQNSFWWVTLSTPVELEPYTTYRVACQSDVASYHVRSTLNWIAVSSAVTVNHAVLSSANYAFTFPNLTQAGIIVGPNVSFDVLPYDTTPPVITLNGPNPQTIYRGTAFTDLGATVTDDFDATRTITGSGTVNTTTVGNYTLTYSAQDEVGNVATPVTRTVEVVLDPNGDEDSDGLNNTEEANLGTNPYLRDTDNDGVNDLREVGDATDPLDPASLNSINLGLVAYYPFNGNAKDESGYGKHGENRGATATTDRSDLADRAYSFDGQSSYIRVADGSLFPREQSEFSVGLWLFVPSADEATDHRFLLTVDAYEQLQIFLSGSLGGPQSFEFYMGGSRVNGPWSPNADYVKQVHGSWQQFVLVRNNAGGGANTVTWYLNGRQFYQTTTTIGNQAPLSDGLTIGRRENGYGPWIGKLDEVRVYDRALSPNEVALLHANDLYAGFGLEGAATKSPFDPATATNWSAGGTAWAVDTAVTHDGVDSVKAQATDGQSTYREYTVTGPAVVDFWWKVSSEKNFDKFSYALNGVNQETISGEVDWAYRTLTLPAGSHTIRWTYSKDESGAVGQDAGWLDDFVVYPATATLQVRDGSTVVSGTATVDFGSADVGSTGFTKTLTFANNGYVPLEVQLSLPEGSPFTFDGGAATYDLLVGRGESVDVPITLATTTAGTNSVQLVIDLPSYNYPPYIGPTPQITLAGYVRGPDIGVAQSGSALTSGQTFDMGLTPRTVEFAIRNNGNSGDLVISAISATGNFQISQQPAMTIPPQGSTTFKVLAQNVASGLQAGSVSITSNAGNLETFSLPLTSKSLISVEGIADGSMATSGTGGATGWDFAATTLPSGQSGQALKTGTTPNNGGSVLEFTTQTAGVVSWSWKVSTQEDFDWLLCEVDGQEAAGISAKNGVWQTQVVHVPSGAKVRWAYRKDASGTIGEDTGYLADVEFRSLAANQSFNQWAQTHGIYDPQQRMPKSGLQAMFGWLGGFGADEVSPYSSNCPFAKNGSQFKGVVELGYRFLISKTADGTQQILYSPDMGAWTTRRISQRIVGEDADRMVIEATAPSGTKGFFKVVGGGNTTPLGMVSVQGGTLPQTSPLSGVEVGSFFIGKHEVTWEEWREVRAWAVGNGYPDLANVGAGSEGSHPVRNVSWYDAVKWTNAKSEMDRLSPVYNVNGEVYRIGEFDWYGAGVVLANSSANGYRLPTDAEWEWAARGGASSQGYVYSGSNDLDEVAWYEANASGAVLDLWAGRGTWPVGTKLANELGIHDMSGNVWEWCWEAVGELRQLRGGGWSSDEFGCSLAYRSIWTAPFNRPDLVGFRVARNAD